jgi:hypothetical protein
MIKSVKKLLCKVLGEKLYFKAMHFLFFYNFGFMKNNASVKHQYFARNLGNVGDYAFGHKNKMIELVLPKSDDLFRARLARVRHDEFNF